MNAFQIVDISNNLVDAKSMITHPAETTHRRLGERGRLAAGITDGYWQPKTPSSVPVKGSGLRQHWSG